MYLWKNRRYSWIILVFEEKAKNIEKYQCYKYTLIQDFEANLKSGNLGY